jgi:C1A family cysteine protease
LIDFFKMKISTAFFVAALLASLTMADPKYTQMFSEFKQTYKRDYKTAEEEASRYRVFVENMKKAEQLQSMNPLARFGANEFADMSAEEFKIRHSGERIFKKMQEKMSKVPPMFTEEQVQSAASSIDWVAKGAVTYVKNQGQCGSCWSFSTTGSIEGQWFLAGNTLTAVSEQELVSCDTTDSGCNGGLMDNAFNWLVNNQGGSIVTESAYPYVSGGGSVPSCSIPSGSVGATISGHQDLPHNEDQMKTWMVTGGPISIGVDASSWQTYMGGILTNCVSNQVDHGVLAVGFYTAASTPYWKVKNSWGASWGEQGYIRIGFGSDQCLITSGPTTSKVTAGPQPPTPPSPPSPTPPTPDSSSSGNVPPPPPPPSPDSSSSTSGAAFTQYTCTDFLCLSCQENSFPQNTCLQTSGGASVVAQCTAEGILLTVYTSSSSCTGAYQQEVEPVNQCLADSAGTYVYNVCPESAPADRTPSIKAYSNKSVQLPKALAAKVEAILKKQK